MFDFTSESNLGKTYNGFILLSIDDLCDYNAKGVFLRHKKTGLEIYHIIKDDKENLFAFAFRTLSKDSKGIAHIMEHSTLCGSEKYPLKEPFSTLASTSLNTFLNAFTYPDKTVYPGASVVQSDYFNMMDVYADAVFFPKLDHATFLQEGHRLELDEKDRLSIQGVVYNEMKGNFASFNQVSFSKHVRAMFPESYPAFDSGGDPLEIPSLTYEEFLDFHQKFYNPDNCLLFLYGNIPTQTQLDFLNERFMNRIEKKYNCFTEVANCESQLPLVKEEIKELQQLKLVEKNVQIKDIAPESGSTGNYVAMTWYTGKSDIEKYFLTEVLGGNDSSPISLVLNESKLGDSVSCGNFGQYPQEVFIIGINGVKKKNEQKVFNIIEETIQKITENGVSQKDIDSAVMGIDFNLREENRYFGPVSIQIMEKTLKGWTVGNACSQNLFPITNFEKLKKQIKQNPDFVQTLMKKYFSKDRVCVKFVCEPSPDYLNNRQIAEEKLIKELEQNLDKVQLRKNLDELHKYQQHVETPSETACIPTTKLSSLDKKIEVTQTLLDFVQGADGTKIPLFINQEDTKGIFYFDVLFPFDNLEPKQLKYIPFLADVITNLGWNGKKWDECIADSACVMGDVWGKTYCGQVSSVSQIQQIKNQYKDLNFIGRYWLGLSTKALTSQAKESLELFSTIITKMDFKDGKRFEKLVQELVAEKKSEIISEARDYAIRRARASSNSYRALVEIMYGISQLQTVKEYSKTNPQKMLKKFEDIYNTCRKSGGILHITADESSLKILLPLIQDFAKKSQITKLLPGKNYTYDQLEPFIFQSDILRQSDKIQIFPMKTQTGFAACSTKASDFLTKQAAAETILSSYLGMHDLWDKIRTTGGAYGAGAWNDNIDNSYIMATYRDPSPHKSLETFLEVLKDSASKTLLQEEVDKTIVSCYGDAIVPVTAKERASRSFEGLLYANPSNLRQTRLDNIMQVTAEDVKNAAKQIYENALKSLSKAIFCDKKLAENIKESGNYLINPL